VKGGWATGALISKNLFLSAGHCFDRTGRGGTRPSRNGSVISEAEIATLMRVDFKYQWEASTGLVSVGDPFPVIALREHRRGLDYAIVELGKNSAGKFPGDVYKWLDVATADVTTPGATLCIIQHPDQGPKVIAAGKLVMNTGEIMAYADIDTDGFSSGAPVLADNGEIVGVHIEGGCWTNGGANLGQAIRAIRAVSDIL